MLSTWPAGRHRVCASQRRPTPETAAARSAPSPLWARFRATQRRPTPGVAAERSSPVSRGAATFRQTPSRPHTGDGRGEFDSRPAWRFPGRPDTVPFHAGDALCTRPVGQCLCPRDGRSALGTFPARRRPGSPRRSAPTRVAITGPRDAAPLTPGMSTALSAPGQQSAAPVLAMIRRSHPVRPRSAQHLSSWAPPASARHHAVHAQDPAAGMSAARSAPGPRSAALVWATWRRPTLAADDRLSSNLIVKTRLE